MSGDKLTLLQRRILRVLAGLTPPWTLTGGGALAGIHLGHRETRDLDLFWRNRGELATLVAEAVAALKGDGLGAQVLRTLAWVLKSYDPRPAARALGWSDADTQSLVEFREWLLEHLTAAGAPE